jgi:hypothetical protein
MNVVILNEAEQGKGVLREVKRNSGVSICYLGKTDPFGLLEKAYYLALKEKDDTSLFGALGKDVSSLLVEGKTFDDFCGRLPLEVKDEFLFHNFSSLLQVLKAMEESSSLSILVGNVGLNNNLSLRTWGLECFKEKWLDRQLRFIFAPRAISYNGLFFAFMAGQNFSHHCGFAEGQGHMFVSSTAGEVSEQCINKVGKNGFCLHMQDYMTKPFEVLEI